MSLEAIEQKCLSYLKQVSNPMVPLDRLIRHLTQADVMGDISEAELVSFLRKHELFRIMDPPGLADNPGLSAMMDAMSINTKPYVILDTRVPTRADVAAALDDQLLSMAEALIAAAREAKDAGEDERVRTIERMLERVTAVRKKLRDTQ